MPTLLVPFRSFSGGVCLQHSLRYSFAKQSSMPSFLVPTTTRFANQSNFSFLSFRLSICCKYHRSVKNMALTLTRSHIFKVKVTMTEHIELLKMCIWLYSSPGIWPFHSNLNENDIDLWPTSSLLFERVDVSQTVLSAHFLFCCVQFHIQD